MSRRRYSNADYRRYRRKKTYRVKTLTAVVSIMMLLTAWAVFTMVIMDEGQGQIIINSSANSDFGHNNLVKTSYDEAILQEAKPVDYTLNFEVPDTSLPKVEEIIGNNIYDKNLFKPVDEIADSRLFDNSVFIGASRTEGLLLYSGISNINGFCYKGLTVDKAFSEKCIQLPGDAGAYTVKEAVELTSYDNYYIMFGINELGWVSIDTFIDNFNDLIDHIYAVNPDATVYVENILPVSKTVSETEEIYTIDRINLFNQRLEEMVTLRGDCIFLDVAAAVTDEDGYLPEEGTTDGKHCNQAYCKRIIQYIRLNTFIRK